MFTQKIGFQKIQWESENRKPNLNVILAEESTQESANAFRFYF